MGCRKSITNSEKLAILREWQRSSATGASLHSFADANNIRPFQLRRWVKLEQRLLESRPDATTVGRGGTPIFVEEQEEAILMWIVEKSDAGIGISLQNLNTHVCQLYPEFGEKSRCAREATLRRFLKKHHLTMRVCSHASPKHPADEHLMAEMLMASIMPRLAGIDRRLIVNMDQTAVFFSMEPRRTIDKVGARRVNIRKASSSTMRVTVAVAVTADGSLLRPMIVFKGHPRGRIALRELPSYPPGSEYVCQPNAWMDGDVMLQWVSKILEPYITHVRVGNASSILLLDSYRCHTMTSVVSSINQLGVRVEHIPGNCTYLLQPVDIGINKPLKARIRNRWETWMLERPVDDVIGPPSRRQLAEWIIESLHELSPATIRKAWRCHDLPYFSD